MPEEPITKASLLEAISASYNAFEKLLSPLTEVQLLTPGIDGGTWSIKDTLAHLSSWHQRALGYLQAAAQKRVPEHLPEAIDEGGVDQVNEQFYQENKQRSLVAILQTFRTTYIELVGAVQLLSEEELYDANRFAWMKGTPLARIVSGNTYEHYQEHAEIIKTWLA